MRNSLQIQLDRLASDRWARRGVRVLIRAIWLALSLVCVGIGLHLAMGWALDWRWLGALALACVAGGAMLVLRPRLRAPEVARRLDRRFRLNEQIATALELDDQPEGVAAYLQDEARRSLGQIRRYISARQQMPWSELALAAALALLLLGLLVIAGVVPPLPNRTAEPLPGLAQPEDPVAQIPEEPFAPPPGSQPAPGGETAPAPGPGDQAAIAALADALRDQSVTRPAADALDQGDVAGAAQSLRELADQAGQLSDQAQSDLASALRDAARQLDNSNPALAEQLRESAQGLEADDQQAAAQALENLADAVEQLGGQVQGQSPAGEQGQGQGAGGAGQGLAGEQREQRTDRLGVDGIPLELESEGEANTPTGGEPQGAASGTSDGGDFSQGSRQPGGDRVDVGDDPLRIPADLRDVVQDYFSE